MPTAQTAACILGAISEACKPIDDTDLTLLMHVIAMLMGRMSSYHLLICLSSMSFDLAHPTLRGSTMLMFTPPVARILKAQTEEHQLALIAAKS